MSMEPPLPPSRRIASSTFLNRDSSLAPLLSPVPNFRCCSASIYQPPNAHHLPPNNARPKPFHFAIVDEVDSVLIDEGRNPLLISGEASEDAERYPVAAKLAELLVRDIHYKVELKDNSVELTEEGIYLAERVLETEDLWDENDHWAS